MLLLYVLIKLSILELCRSYFMIFKESISFDCAALSFMLRLRGCKSDSLHTCGCYIIVINPLDWTSNSHFLFQMKCLKSEWSNVSPSYSNDFNRFSWKRLVLNGDFIFLLQHWQKYSWKYYLSFMSNFQIVLTNEKITK